CDTRAFAVPTSVSSQREFTRLQRIGRKFSPRSGSVLPNRAMKKPAFLLLLAGCVTPSSLQPAPGYPRAMIIPQPEDQVSFQVDGREWLRYHYGDQTPKPYFYPVMGPAG